MHDTTPSARRSAAPSPRLRPTLALLLAATAWPAAWVAGQAAAQDGATDDATAPQAACEVMPAFADATLDDWKVREFAGLTDYRLIDEDGVRTLAAHTDAAASVLYREREIDVASMPTLSWSWRVDNVYGGVDETSREGDDFPARLYVVVKTGLFPWQTLALNYVWASEAPVGTSWPNPFTDKAHMIVVRSGTDELGDWVCESRDVVADFREAFGVDVTRIDGYAVMVDADNTGGEASARFGTIAFGS